MFLKIREALLCLGKSGQVLDLVNFFLILTQNEAEKYYVEKPKKKNKEDRRKKKKQRSMLQPFRLNEDRSSYDNTPYHHNQARSSTELGVHSFSWTTKFTGLAGSPSCSVPG